MSELAADFATLRRMGHELEGVSIGLLDRAVVLAPATGDTSTIATYAFDTLTDRMSGLSRRAADLDDALDAVRIGLVLADEGVASTLRFEG